MKNFVFLAVMGVIKYQWIGKYTGVAVLRRFFMVIARPAASYPG